MELRQLKTFHTVATTLSFTKAANELGYVQSSITAQIQALEKELGVPLFDRLGKRIVLTDAGRRLLGYAEKLVSISEEARLVVTGGSEPEGTVTVSASETHCTYRLPELLNTFRSRFPQVSVRLRPSIIGALDGDLQRSLSKGEIDLAFVLEEPLEPNDSLSVEPLVAEPVVVLAPPDHPLAAASSVGPADLENQAIMLTAEGCVYRGLFERSLSQAGVRNVKILEFASVEAIKQCCRVGVGVAVLSAASVTSEISQGQLKQLPWTGPDCGVVTQVVWRSDKWLSPALRAFLEMSVETLSSGFSHNGLFSHDDLDAAAKTRGTQVAEGT